MGNVFTDAVGPDVTTSCGAIGRVLSAGERYVVGLGGPCNPINEWSTLNSFSESELSALRQYNTNPSVFCQLLSTTTVNMPSTTTETESQTTTTTLPSVTTDGFGGSNAESFIVNILTLLLVMACALWVV